MIDYKLADSFVADFLRRCPSWTPLRDDLRQEAAIGLLMAAERFDSERGAKFTTFARHWMRSCVGRFWRRYQRHALGEITNASASELDFDNTEVDPLGFLAAEFVDTADTLARVGQQKEALLTVAKRIHAKIRASHRSQATQIAAVWSRGESAAAIGRELGLTRERVRQILKTLGLVNCD